MLSRWFNTKFRAAELALEEGRIDDAVRHLLAADFRDPRAQPIVQELERRLLARARIHLIENRPGDALSDLDRLEAFSPAHLEARADLRRRAVGRISATVDQREVQQAVQKALAEGRLTSLPAMIDSIHDERLREWARGQLQARTRKQSELAQALERSLDARDPLAALSLLRDLRQDHAVGTADTALEERLAQHLTGHLEELFHSGKLQALLDAVAQVAAFGAPRGLSEWEFRAALLRRAAEALGSFDVRRLHDSLLRLSGMQPAPPWLAPALDAARNMLSARDQLVSGPLGLLDAISYAAGPQVRAVQTTREARGAESIPASPGADLHSPLLLLVDAGGTSLVIARSLIRIGRRGAAGIDVGLPAEVQSHHADVIREKGDYILSARAPLRVNHRDVARAILRDGDRISLNRRARLIFRRPSARSGTAVLQLGDGLRLPEDVSQVVMLDDTCLIGPGPHMHVPLRAQVGRAVLFTRHGQLWGRVCGADGRAVGPSQPLPIEQTVQLGDVRLTLKQPASREERSHL